MISTDFMIKMDIDRWYMTINSTDKMLDTMEKSIEVRYYVSFVI